MYKKVKRFFPNINQGLNSEQVKIRIAEGLTNKSPEDPLKTTYQIVKDNIFTFFNLFNIVLAILIALVGSYENLLFLWMIISNTAIAIIQEIRSRNAIEKLSILSTPQSNVIRNGQNKQISVEDIVLDDICLLRSGNQVCADSIVENGQVEVSEALLTGESDPILKKQGDVLLSGSFIVSGKCYARVNKVGVDSFTMQMTKDIKQYKRSSSKLTNALDKIVKFTGLFTVPLGILLFINSYFVVGSTLQYAVTSVAAALLGMMPKGLVLLASVSLAVGVIKLAKEKTLVQELFCIETLSRVDLLCLDKTGTLTKGNMILSKTIDLGLDKLPLPLGEVMGNFIRALDDNSSSFLAIKEKFMDYNTLEEKSKKPFSSERKWSSVSFKNLGTIVLGAPEILLKDQERNLVESILDTSHGCFRTLLLSYSKQEVNQDNLPKNLIPIVLFVLDDPIKPDAKSTLNFFQHEGVDIKIISGDNPKTVSNIAKKVDLPQSDSYVDLSNYPDDFDLSLICKKYKIFGRVSPLQKKNLIEAFKHKGHTVAMIGDGVNDVLALKSADCSIAMANGSDVARQISQLVLMDSNFSSLKKVVMEGRRVINNITRTASLFLVKTIFSFLFSFLSLALSMPYPFIPIQLSLISVLMEAIPSFFLAFEPSKEKVNNNFLSVVFNQSLPTGLIIVIDTIIINFLQPILHLSQLEISTSCVYISGIAWLIQLFYICKPFSKSRLFLCLSMGISFFTLSYLFKDLLNICEINFEIAILLIVLSALYYPTMKLIHLGIKKVSFIKNTKIFKLIKFKFFQAIKKHV